MGIILAPIIAAIILFVMSGIRHLLVIMIVGRGNAGFEATLRVQAYTFATRLFWWIPILGAIVGFFYWHLPFCHRHQGGSLHHDRQGCSGSPDPLGCLPDFAGFAGCGARCCDLHGPPTAGAVVDA